MLPGDKFEVLEIANGDIVIRPFRDTRRLLSLAPGFSQVKIAPPSLTQPLQRFDQKRKPLKRLRSSADSNTRLKPGANEKPAKTARRSAPAHSGKSR